MKKVFSLMLLLATMLTFTACSSDDDEPAPEPQEVEVKLDYSLFESGSMTRSGETVYQQFYNDYIKTKELAPDTYSLSFFHAPGDEYKQRASGPWNGAMVSLRTGDYHVVGESYPSNYNNNDAASRYVSDKLYLKFDETITVSSTTTNLKLNAKYDCYLLLFNKEGIKKITYNFQRSDKDASTIGNVFYMFVYKDTDSNERLYVDVEKTDNTKIKLIIAGNGFEKGKYYYFNDITNSFDIEPMENGNQ